MTNPIRLLALRTICEASDEDFSLLTMVMLVTGIWRNHVDVIMEIYRGFSDVYWRSTCWRTNQPRSCLSDSSRLSTISTYYTSTLASPIQQTDIRLIMYWVILLHQPRSKGQDQVMWYPNGCCYSIFLEFIHLADGFAAQICHVDDPTSVLASFGETAATCLDEQTTLYLLNTAIPSAIVFISSQRWCANGELGSVVVFR